MMLESTPLRVLALGACLAATSALSAAAQSVASSAEARTAQYVLVVDDSGSMKKTDPNRLSIFAVRSLLGMLDERDEVSLVRLNGPWSGEEPPPIEPLAVNRQGLSKLLADNGRLAAYDGDSTRCRSALAAVRRLLEAAYRPNVAQTVIFLTDGKCTPAAEETPLPDALLGGLRSHDEGLFHFFLLRFPGEVPSRELGEIARATGGDTIEVGASDAAAILHGFALALSRSQGYEAQLLSPGEPEIAAHRGARRVRLLVVAPGEAPPLTASLHDRQGRPVPPLAPARAGTHRHGTGAPFRFVALDYRPSESPITARVEGAGGRGWKAVALPEYRLFVRMQVLSGECSSPGPPIEHGVRTGSSICLVVELVNENGRVVEGDLTGRDLTASVRLEQPGGKPIELPANPLGREARFGLERRHLEQGDYILQPLVRLDLAGGSAALPLRGRPLSLQASSVTVRAEPSALSIGELRPGEERTPKLKLMGTFQPTPGRIELRDRRDVPSCLTFELSGVAEGAAQSLSPGQEYTLAARAAPFCGPGSSRQRISTRLRVVFDPGAGGGGALAAVEVPIDLVLVNQVEVSEGALLRLRDGRSANGDIMLLSNHRRELKLRAAVEPGGGSWPGERLALSLAGGDHVEIPPAASAVPIALSGTAHRCCPGGSYAARLRLEPADTAAYAPGGRPVEPIVVPVRVEVEPAGFWACRGPLVLWILLGLLLALLALYVVSMIRHSSFLDVDRLAEKLVPLAWGGFGSTVPRRDAGEVRRLVTRTLTPGRRLAAWLKANPLRFGLPGGSYRETVELLLQPHRDLARTQLVLKADRELPARLRREPEAFAGRLFAIAEGGVTFVAVPAAEGRIGPLVEPGAAAAGGWQEEAKPKAVTLRRGTRLLRPMDDWEVADEGGAAGWQLG